MANTASAEKRNRQAQKRRARNVQVRTGVSAVKKAREAITQGDAASPATRSRAAARAIEKATSKGRRPQERRVAEDLAAREGGREGRRREVVAPLPLERAEEPRAMCPPSGGARARAPPSRARRDPRPRGSPPRGVRSAPIRSRRRRGGAPSPPRRCARWRRPARTGRCAGAHLPRSRPVRRVRGRAAARGSPHRYAVTWAPRRPPWRGSRTPGRARAPRRPARRRVSSA